MDRKFSRFSFLLLCFSFILLAGCDRRWNEVIVKKRLYTEGFYVHIPGKRTTDPQQNPKPSQYPTTASRNTIARTGYDTAAVADQPTRIPTPEPSPNPTQTYQRYYPPPQQPYRYGNSPGPRPDTSRASGYGGVVPRRDTGVIAQQRPDTLRRVPIYVAQKKDTLRPYAGEQPTPKDSIVPIAQNDTLVPPDTLIAQQDSVPPPDSSAVVSKKPRKHRRIDGEPSAVVMAGLASPQQDYGYPVKWNSFAAGGGIRYTMKVKKKDRIVLDLGYRLNQFYIGQERRKFAPLTAEKHDRERITVNSLSMSLCGRVNFVTPEDQPKKWLDVGVYGDNTFRTSNVFVDKRYNTELADREKVTTKLNGLHYMSTWNYGITARYTSKYFNVFTMYRLSDLIQSPSAAGEYHRDLPRLIVGIELQLGGE